MGPCRAECCTNRDKEKHLLWRDKIHTQAGFVSARWDMFLLVFWLAMEGQCQHQCSHVDLLDGNPDPRRLRWGQTDEVLHRLSSSSSRLRSHSVCRWKDTLTSVCHELGSLRERMAAIPSPSSESHGQCWKLLAHFAVLDTQNRSRVWVFLTTTEVVSTSRTLADSPAGYCWTLPQAQMGVCVTYQRQKAAT